MKTDFSQIPATEGVYKLAKGEGERFDVAGARFTWKVKGDKTAYAFSVYEQTLDPGEGLPPHSHAYAEVFYLLGGAVDFLRITDGKEDWVRCEKRRDPSRSCNNHENLRLPHKRHEKINHGDEEICQDRRSIRREHLAGPTTHVPESKMANQSFRMPCYRSFPSASQVLLIPPVPKSPANPPDLELLGGAVTDEFSR
jgi:hypothetical protein